MRKAVRAIMLKDNALLVMRRNKFNQQFYSLVGGGVDMGESAEQALEREVHEESSITFTNPRLVIIEDAGPIFGTQYIYMCDYVSGEPILANDSEEAKITAIGQNLYQPQWLPLDELQDANLLPRELKEAVIHGLQSGFGDEPLALKIAG